MALDADIDIDIHIDIDIDISRHHWSGMEIGQRRPLCGIKRSHAE